MWGPELYSNSVRGPVTGLKPFPVVLIINDRLAQFNAVLD